jgi:hypothetical protein
MAKRPTSLPILAAIIAVVIGLYCRVDANPVSTSIQQFDALAIGREGFADTVPGISLQK